MKKEIFQAFIFYILITLFFFNPVLKSWIPFPGDLLVGNYNPYNSYSFLGYASGGYPHKAQDFDVVKLLYPLKELTIEMFKNGQFPLWNPYNFSGNPHLAGFQSGSFYVFNLLFFIFPFIIAWLIYIFTQNVLAGVFTYFLLREFKLSKKSAFFGGLVFAFCSYLTVWLEYGNVIHTVIWLPLLILLSIKNIHKPSLIKSTLMVFILALSILAGYIQSSIYLFTYLAIFISFYLLSSEKNNKIKTILIFIPIFILPILLCAVQLLPTIELFLNSTRSAYTTSSFLKMLIPPIHTVTFFAPDFFGNPATRNYFLSGTYIERVSYIGVLPLFFLIYGLFQKRTFLNMFFLISMFIVFLLTFDTFISRFFYSLNIPIISTAVPSRMMYIFCFTGSILSAFGFEFYSNNQGKKTLLKTILILGGIYILLWMFTFSAPHVFKGSMWIDSLIISKRNLILPSLLFFLTTLVLLLNYKLTFMKRYLFIFIIIITVFDLYYFFQKITPFSPLETVYPKTEVLSYLKKIQGIDRYWGYGSGYIEPNFETHEKIFSPDGYDALHIKQYGELMSASKDGKISADVPRSEAFIAPGFGTKDLRDNNYRQKMLNLLGVKFILHKTNILQPDYETFNDTVYKLIWQGKGWQIYENKNVLPRLFFASKYLVENKKEKVIEKIFDPKINLRETLILEEGLPKDIELKDDPNALIQIKNYSPNKIILKTSSKTNMLLFLSDNYYPGWKISIDNKNDKIYRANYTFRSALIKEGKHEIIFSYEPQSFDYGFKISLITFLGLISVFLIKLRKLI